MNQARKFLSRAFEIREGEFLRSFLMFFYLLLTIASYITTSSARDSLFLKRLGPDQLPYVYILIAAVVGVISPIYLKVAGRVTLNQLIRYTSLGSILSLFLFWLVLRSCGPWMYYVLYIWVSLFGAITTSQFWLMANHAFNPREAKRLFAFIGTGGVLGGIFGGSFTNFGAKWFGTDSLLLWSAGFVGISALLAERVWRDVTLRLEGKRVEERRLGSLDRTAATGRLVKLILNSTHLTLLTAILSLTVIIDSFTDYQLKYLSNNSFGARDQLTSFFGTLFVCRGVFSLLFQAFLTGRILKNFGVGISILFLPTSLLLGSLILAFDPRLWAVILLKVSDGSFRFSIHRSGIELLYLPIPLRIKDRVKGFIDIFIDRFGLGVGGLLLLLFTSVLTLSIPQLSLVVCGLVFVWIVLSIIIKREYLNTFRLALEKKTIQPEDVRIRISDNATIATLTKALGSSDERQVLYALRLLVDSDSVAWLSQVPRLLSHPSARVRAQAIKSLANQRDRSMEAVIVDCLTDPDLEVRGEVIHYLCSEQDGQSSEKIETFLRHDDYSIVGAAIHCILKYQMPGKGFIDQAFIEKAMAQDGKQREAARIAAASALGLVSSRSPLQAYLRLLLQDSSVEVARSAVQTAGRIANPEALPLLINKLADPLVRSDVREALLEYGNSIVQLLSDRMSDAREPMAIRVNIPKVLCLLGTQETVDALVRNIHQPDQFLAYRVIKALNKMRVAYPTLSFKYEVFDRLTVEELKDYQEFGAILQKLESSKTLDSGALPLLRKTLQERMDHKLEKVFRLLGLRYPPQDIYFAYNGIRSQKSILRASAIEFLDNLLLPDLKRVLFPILEGTAIKSFIGEDSRTSGVQPKSNNSYLKSLILGHDAWLKTIALYVAGSLQLADLAPLVREAIDAPDITISQTARWSWDRLNNSAVAFS
jgi:AAA family ATP:ADP antiporter